MAMMKCRECRERISTQASPCPKCGDTNPGVSRQEEEIEAQLKKWNDEEKRQERLYIEAGRNTFLWWGHKRVRHHVNLANAAQHEARKIRDKLYEVQRRWSEENYE